MTCFKNLIALLLIAITPLSGVVGQHLVGTGSHQSRIGDILWDGSIGEAVIYTKTLDSKIFTQGYLQPVFMPSDVKEYKDVKELVSNVEVFPNPFMDQLTIKSDIRMSFTLYDALQRPVREFTAEAQSVQTIELVGLPAGPYLLVARTERIPVPVVYELIKTW